MAGPSPGGQPVPAGMLCAPGHTTGGPDTHSCNQRWRARPPTFNRCERSLRGGCTRVGCGGAASGGSGGACSLKSSALPSSAAAAAAASYSIWLNSWPSPCFLHLSTSAAARRDTSCNSARGEKVQPLAGVARQGAFKSSSQPRCTSTPALLLQYILSSIASTNQTQHELIGAWRVCAAVAPGGGAAPQRSRRRAQSPSR